METEKDAVIISDSPDRILRIHNWRNNEFLLQEVIFRDGEFKAGKSVTLFPWEVMTLVNEVFPEKRLIDDSVVNSLRDEIRSLKREIRKGKKK